MLAFLPHGHEWFALVPVALVIVFVLNLITGEISIRSGTRVISREETPDVYWGLMAFLAFFIVITLMVTARVINFP